ncbi:surface lipoprotein assembly modifier [Acinetobacter populi]|uniref:Peptide signal protein n=1 Tax=Acinetobacter populi TaxID=1582270 RepID=A0A1Z9YWD2_9GAMM|nr:surface lipoprotein assembly modifier [Acinetobacter populi]OUY06504.1 peptide signal protein [Acinetobacter populi]
MKKIFLFCTLLSIQQLIHAADNDTQLRLNQDIQQQQIQKDQSLQEQQRIDRNVLPSMVIKGETIKVEQNVEDVGRALYIAVMQKQWQAAAIYLDAYLKLEGYDQSLALFAQGALARVQGKAEQAEQDFREALKLQPQNQMIKLELARVLTEKQKNRDAKRLFLQVKDQLSLSDDKTAQNIVKTINTYLKGLDQRDAWQGSIAFGGRYVTNLNSSAEYNNTTFWYATDAEGEYLLDDEGNKILVYTINQGSPDPINTTGLDYEATLSKRWSLAGNHGIAFRGLGYGQVYPNESDYNELTFNFNAGYSYQDQKSQILIAPIFEHKYYGREALYNAWGGRAEWMHFIGKDKALKLETEIKDFNYTNYTSQNGVEYSAFSTFWKILPKQWTLFGGLDYVDHNTEEQYIAAYQQEGVRIGVSKQFQTGFTATLYNSYRWRQFDKYATVFETRRHDFEQNYNLIVSAPKWQFYGLTPTLNYRYNRNKSNVDWLYSYDKHNISLKLEHRF